MLDIRFIRENAELVEKKAKQKGYDVNISRLLELDAKRREVLSEIEVIRAKRNELVAQASGERPSEQAIEEGKKLKEQLAGREEEVKPLVEELDKVVKDIPNIFPDDTPEGGEENNREEKTWGETSDKGFEVIDHQTWAEAKGLLDFERGAKVAGNKFYFTKGSLVELEFALVQLGLSIVKKHGFEPMLVPNMVNSRIIEGTGFSARGEEKQIYEIKDQDLNLIATAEIPLTGYHADEVFASEELPKLYAGYSPAYRMEAGAYGKHSRGLYRVHQFNKLELYAFCKPEDSEAIHQKILALEEEICQALEIPYRVVRIAAGDLGAPAYKKYDIEYWSPVDKAYRELTSCSNVTDYQARRLNVRYKTEAGNTEYVNTLNGTAVVMSRAPIAIIENHQEQDGTVKIPEALRPFMGGQETL